MKLTFKCAVISAVLLVPAMCSVPVTFAAPPTNACMPLTTAQVSAVLGVSVEAGKPLSPANTKLCHWGALYLAGKRTSNKGVMLSLQDPRAFAYAKMPVGNGITKVAVSGIGDDAVYGTPDSRPY